MLNLKPFRQKPSFCGPACLKMVLDYYGVKRSEKQLAKLAHTTSKGTPGNSMIEVAKRLGFKAFIKDFSDIKDVKKYVIKENLPVIVDWFSIDDGHYSVVVDVDKENIYIQDPEMGNLRAFRIKDFKRDWFDFFGGYLKSKNQLIIRRMIIIKPNERIINKFKNI